MTSIALIDQTTASDVFEFVCREFVRGSELHRATGVGTEEYTEYFRAPFFEMIEEKLSFVTMDKNTGEVTACLLAGRFQPCDSALANTPRSIQPIKAILVELEKVCLPLLSQPLENTVLVDIAMVAPAVSGQGIYSGLRKALHQQAAARGFAGVVGELSSKATQVVCVQKLGHRLVGQVDYQSFEFNGAYPFAKIKNTDSIQLVEHVLQ